MEPLRIETGWPVPALWPNSRLHRMRVWSAQKTARKEAYWSTCLVKPRNFVVPAGRLTIAICAQPAVNRGRDDDNLIAACKAFRDGIAEALGVDDKLLEVQPVEWGEKHKTGRLIFTIGAER